MGDASQGANRAVSEAASASRSPALRILARAGFVFIGLVHVLIGVIALQVNSGQGGDSDQHVDQADEHEAGTGQNA